MFKPSILKKSILVAVSAMTLGTAVFVSPHQTNVHADTVNTSTIPNYVSVAATLQQLNNQRTKLNLPAYQLNQDLSNIAQTRVQQVIAKFGGQDATQSKPSSLLKSGSSLTNLTETVTMIPKSSATTNRGITNSLKKLFNQPTSNKSQKKFLDGSQSQIGIAVWVTPRGNTYVVYEMAQVKASTSQDADSQAQWVNF